MSDPHTSGSSLESRQNALTGSHRSWHLTAETTHEYKKASVKAHFLFAEDE